MNTTMQLIKENTMSKIDTAYKAAYILNTVVSYAMTAAFVGAVAWAVLSGRKTENPVETQPETPSETASN